MMENKFELIEKYIYGELSVQEKLRLEELLLQDSNLLKEFALRKEINQAVIEEDVINLRRVLQDISQKESKTRSFKVIQYTSVAAVILLLISISSIFFIRNIKVEEDLYLKYYEAYPSIINSRSISIAESENLILGAFNDYDNERYEEASVKFKTVVKKDPSDYLSIFYLAVCELENEELKSSEKHLKVLTKDSSHILWEQAHWYLALNYLKQGDNEKCIEILEQIKVGEMYKKQEAIKLLKSLK